MILRNYQIAAEQAIHEYFHDHKGNPIIAMPTGTGKSLVIGSFIQNVFSAYANQRVMMLTHVKELIQQNAAKLFQMWPTAPAGIYSAGLKRREVHFPITYAGIASVASKATHFGHIDLVLIDECHLISPNAETMYRSFLADLRKKNPFLKVVGFTATPYRLGVGMLTDGGLFTDVCFDMTGLDPFNWLVEEGYLCPLIPKRTGMTLDVTGVHKTGGEFKANELQEAVDHQELTHAAVREMVELGSDRAHWLLFASGIEHAEHIAAMLDTFNIPACVIHSKMGDEQRDDAIKGFKSGKYRAAVNNNVLTTGFDFPEIDLIGMLRPTSSPGLWVQMLGRGTRPVYAKGYDLQTKTGRLTAIAAGVKQTCLVLDFAGNTRRLGPINDPVIPKAKGKGGGGEAPVKICEVCETYNHASVRFCMSCGNEFPRHLKINTTAYTDEVMAASAPVIETFQVDKVTYAHHNGREGRPPSMQVSYFCGLRMFREFICFEHYGFPKHLSHEWWKQRHWDAPPETVTEALQSVNDLRQPKQIKVWVKKIHSEVKGYEF